MPTGNVGPAALRSQEVHGQEAGQEGADPNPAAGPAVQWDYPVTDGDALYLARGQVRPVVIYNAEKWS